MGVLVECETIVIRNATVEERFPGGVAEYERCCPNQTFSTDGVICRIGFMTGADAFAYISHLETFGFLPPSVEGSPEVALINETSGFVFPCAWLQIDRVDLPGKRNAAVAWLRGTDLSQLVAPPGWEPGTSIQLTREELKKEYEFLGVEDRLEVYRHRHTGETVYVGRPRIPPRKRWWKIWQ